MTGIRPSTSGVYSNGQDWRKNSYLQKIDTIPQYFRKRGYRAIGGGKIFHALSFRFPVGNDNKNEDGYNDPDSWDEYFPSLKRQMPDEPRPQKPGFARNGAKKITDPDWAAPWFLDWAAIEPDDGKMVDTQVVDWAVDQLKKKQGKPLFLAVGIYRPHVPWYVPRKYFDLYPLDKIKLPKVREDDLDDCSPVGQKMARRAWHRWILRTGNWKKATQGYLASISFADAQVGRLMKAFDKSKIAKNTVIVLWTDHGFHIGEKENWEKFTLWEESTRVPFIVVAPGVSRVNGECRTPVNLLDIYPTLLELCGLKKNKSNEGESIVRFLKDPGKKSDRVSITTWGRNNHAVRSHRYRYIQYHDDSEELYDHEKDPDEFTNLAQKKGYDKIIRQLKRHIPKINAERDPVSKKKRQKRGKK